MNKKDLKRIKQIKERLENTTPGRWRVEKYYHDEPGYEEFIKSAAVVARDNRTITRNDWSNPAESDLEFIANAKQDIEYLLKRYIPIRPKIMELSRYEDAEPFDKIVCGNCSMPFTELIEWEDLYDDEKIKKFSENMELSEFVYCPKCGQRIDWGND